MSTMSPARRHRLKIEARRAALAAGGDSAAGETSPSALAIVTETAALRPDSMTPAAKHRLKHAGAAAATVATGADNDNDAGAQVAEPTAKALIRMQLAGDKRQLKAVQSMEARSHLKRQLIESYTPWIAGLIAGAATHRLSDPAFKAPQDDILIAMLIWRLDIGDLVEAARLFDFAAEHGFSLPPTFKRNLPTFVAEQASEFALAEIKADRPVALEALAHIAGLVAQADMPDEVRAVLHKAMGLELHRRAGFDEVGPRKRVRLMEAKSQLERARDLDGRSGVNGALGKVERELKSLNTGDTQDPPPGEQNQDPPPGDA